jgi:Zinc carboxypeptidase
VSAPQLRGTMLIRPLFVMLFARIAAAKEACNETKEATTEATKPYRILSSKQIKQRLESLEIRFPTLIHVETAQGTYGLPVAGNASDCLHEGGKGCLNYYATIQDFEVHPVGSESSKNLPGVLLSGALHGDERVGPTAVVEMAQIVLRAAACEANLRESCRASLLAMGIKDRDRRWLARLVTTRRLVIVPTANALGYDRNQREEGEVDVNRDFPFDVLDSRDCMRSVAARSLNELFRDDQFQMAVTFHAGMEMIGFQWGAESYMNDPVSPDDQGQYEVARAMSQFSGSFPGTPQYPYGISNMVVYPVRGGMEDWAYAGSWDKPRSKYIDGS